MTNPRTILIMKKLEHPEYPQKILDAMKTVDDLTCILLLFGAVQDFYDGDQAKALSHMCLDYQKPKVVKWMNNQGIELKNGKFIVKDEKDNNGRWE